MSVQRLSLCGLALFLAAQVSGCSMLGFGDEDRSASRSNECTWSRSSCMYEGQYEPNEEEYAEEEAKRLNRASAARVRGW
ncbi:hypothetical protein H0A62_09345 [Pusillimonas harenae]|uniref:Type IV conjugative transfer system protein TraV n=2 Tax=Pollutimonas harenae TaxID=657015 RepID=A0A853GUI5_9BURK|nr:hypothetical protein [Pollutimonas harenae]NYT85807.1 hypothetical protein [Pollutimonas harenae]TEA71527.1 hypothetical protein ERD84_09415 [Pollutimonas harenae]